VTHNKYYLDTSISTPTSLIFPYDLQTRSYNMSSYNPMQTESRVDPTIIQQALNEVNGEFPSFQLSRIHYCWYTPLIISAILAVVIGFIVTSLSKIPYLWFPVIFVMFLVGTQFAQFGCA
jgi:hypothetical protein